MDGMLRDSRVLITYRAGFIGSNLVESLLLSGNFVACLDNFSHRKRENLREFSYNPNMLMNFLQLNFQELLKKLKSCLDIC
jgi:nucleoside-diphosphate-sugar epimerase